MRPKLKQLVTQLAALALALGLVACDAQLKPFDTVDVQVDLGAESPTISPPISTVAPTPAPPTVDLGSTVLTNATYHLKAQTTGATRFVWSATGPGEVQFSPPDAADTTVTASADGTYLLRLTVSDDYGQKATGELNFVWDTTPPAVDAGLDIQSSTAFTAAATVSGATSIAWSAASNRVSFDATTKINPVITATADGLYVISLTAQDDAGNKATDTFNLVWDTGPPPPLTTLAAQTGSSLATIALTLTLPLDISDYQKIELRRAVGATPPASDCLSGQLAATLTEFPTNPLTVTDDTETAGTTYSYRACIYDYADNLVSSQTAVSIQAKPHVLFLSSASYAGNLGGLGGGDADCATLANAVPALAGESNWRAILSTTTLDAQQRLGFYGTIEDTQNAVVATNGTDFWDGFLSTAPSRDETGTDQGATSVWTGSTSDGIRVANEDCTAWTGVASGQTGDSSSLAFTWTADATPLCSSTAHLYCLSQYRVSGLTHFSAAPDAVTAGGVDLTLAYPSDTSKYDRIELRRLAGATAPSADCTDGTVAQTLHAPFTSTTVVDATGSPATTFSYRACVFEKAGNLVAAPAPAAVTSHP